MTATEAARAIGELRKAGQLEQALRRAREAFRQWPEDQALRRAIAWCLWERVKALVERGIDDRSWQEVLRDLALASEWARDSVVLGAYNDFDALPLMVTTVMRKAKASEMPARVAEAARFADPSLLSDSQKGDFASPRMAWLSYATGAWADLKDWQSLLHLEEQAVPIPKQRDREWVIYRFALAHENTGDPQGALRLLEMAFPTISAPWQRVAKARMLSAAGRTDDAVLEARRALASTRRDDLLLTIDAFHVVARNLAGSDRSRAVAHAAIALAVRQERGYGSDAKLRQTLVTLGVTELEAAGHATIAEQTAWWKAADTSVRSSGEVTKHLPHGGAGFITGDDGKQYYFSKKRDDDRPLLPVGTKVTFEAVSSFDAKRNAPSLKAVKVRRI